MLGKQKKYAKKENLQNYIQLYTVNIAKHLTNCHIYHQYEWKSDYCYVCVESGKKKVNHEISECVVCLKIFIWKE